MLYLVTSSVRRRFSQLYTWRGNRQALRYANVQTDNTDFQSGHNNLQSHQQHIKYNLFRTILGV